VEWQGKRNIFKRRLVFTCYIISEKTTKQRQINEREMKKRKEMLCQILPSCEKETKIQKKKDMDWPEIAKQRDSHSIGVEFE